MARLIPRVKTNVLFEFVTNPDKEFTLYSIGKRVQPNSAPGSRIRRYMDELVTEGFLSKRVWGGVERYRLHKPKVNCECGHNRELHDGDGCFWCYCKKRGKDLK